MPWDRDGDEIYAVAGEAITADQCVTIDPADDKAYKACAATGSEQLPCLGFAATDAALGQGLYIKIRGAIRPAPNSLTTGLAYVSNTAGAISASAGNTSQIVGRVVPTRGGGHELQINPAIATADTHPAAS